MDRGHASPRDRTSSSLRASRLALRGQQVPSPGPALKSQRARLCSCLQCIRCQIVTSGISRHLHYQALPEAPGLPPSNVIIFFPPVLYGNKCWWDIVRLFFQISFMQLRRTVEHKPRPPAGLLGSLLSSPCDFRLFALQGKEAISYSSSILSIAKRCAIYKKIASTMMETMQTGVITQIYNILLSLNDELLVENGNGYELNHYWYIAVCKQKPS